MTSVIATLPSRFSTAAFKHQDWTFVDYSQCSTKNPPATE